MARKSGIRMVSLRELIGEGYDDVWWWDGRYVVIKGSRASKKSYTIAYWIVLHMMELDMTNTLVVRKIADTNRDSTYAVLSKVIYLLGVEDQWRFRTSPLELEYRGRCKSKADVGQKILFRGLDDPQKLASVTASYGEICFEWVEEAFQIANEADFDKIDQSIRGKMPNGVKPKIFITFNPWHQEHWLKRRFFDNPDSETLAKTTNYMVNEFLSDYDRKMFEDMKERNPRMYEVAGLGNWGVSEGLIFTNWTESDFDKKEIAKRDSVISLFGLDFGYTNDPTALVCALMDKATRTIYVFDELYEKGLDNIELSKRITEMGYAKERIVADCAEPKSIYELQKYGGLTRVVPAIKGSDIMYGIQKLQQYHIIIHPRCVNTLTEIGLYCFDVDRKTGQTINKPVDAYNHCLVAGTMVTTEHGWKPIEDVCVGEKVLTHIGYRKVIASGITRPTVQPIWRMTLDDGAVLEGTEDHPIVTMEGVKRLRDLSKGDKVIRCLESGKAESHGTGILTVPTTNCGHTIDATVRQFVKGTFCTAISGRNTMARYLKGIRFIASTGIPSTTTYPTCNVCRPWSTSINIHGPNPSKRGCAEIPIVRTDVGHGTNPRKGMNGTYNTLCRLHNRWRKENMCAFNAMRFSWPYHSGPINSAQTDANPNIGEIRAWMTRSEFVRYVGKSSQSTSTGRTGPAPEVAEGSYVAGVEEVRLTGRYEYVYDLTVEESHEFFANGVYVLNCMDALRYSVLELLYRSGGKAQMVIGANDTYDLDPKFSYEKENEPPKRKSRVFSA